MTSKRIFLSILTLVFLTACNDSADKTPSGSQETGMNLESKLKSGEKLATQSGVEVHEGYLELLQSINPNIANQMKSPAGKKRLINNLLEQELLYQESLKQGVADIPKYKEKVALYERVIIAQGLLEEEIQKRAKKYYDENKEKEFSQVGLAHILIRTRKPIPGKKDDKGVSEEEALAKAKEAKAKLEGGAKWEEVVTEYSEDRLTKSRGGQLGKINRDDRRAKRLNWGEMIEQAFKMKEGEISGPIKARDGYHIIKVTEAPGVAPFEEVETRIKFKLRGPVKKEVLADLGGDAEVEYLVEELKETSTPQATPQPKTAPGGKQPPEKKSDHGHEHDK